MRGGSSGAADSQRQSRPNREAGKGATFCVVTRGLAYYTTLDSTRPWPGIDRDPARVEQALLSMANGGRVVRLGCDDFGEAERKPSNDIGGAAIACIAPSLVTALDTRTVLQKAAEQVYIGGLVVCEEPTEPTTIDPEPLLVERERVVVWSSAAGAEHDLRVIEFEATRPRGAEVKALQAAPIDRSELALVAEEIGMTVAGVWCDWSFSESEGPWQIVALRRVT